jgi:hypothetical protein
VPKDIVRQWFNNNKTGETYTIGLFGGLINPIPTPDKEFPDSDGP